MENSLSAHLQDVLGVCVKGSISLSMRVLWEATKNIFDTKVMAHMARGTRVEIVMTGSVPCIINLEDGARPCWA